MDGWTRLVATGEAAFLEEEEARRALAAFADPDGYIVLRSAPSYRFRTVKGSDLDGMVRAVKELAGGATAVGWSLHPVSSAFVTAGHAMRTGDAVELRWLMVDCDPRRESGSNATDAEHESARRKALDIHEDLSAYGWPAPAIVDSGNGWHLYYRIDLPNDLHTRKVLARALKALADLHGDDRVEIDHGVSKATTFGKVPGTLVRKGPNTEERPHRVCRILSLPDELIPVSIEALMQLAGPEPPTSRPVWAFRLNVPSRETKAYGKAAMDREIQRVLLAEQRNNALHRAACSLYQLVGGGVLFDAEVQAALLAVSEQVGLPGKEARGTIDSAKKWGLDHPRGIPEREQQPGSSHGTHANNGAKEEQQTTGEEKIVVIRADRITPRKVEWLWPGRIPLGKLTTFAGIGGLGKTFVLCEIAARVTRGMPWPDGQTAGQPGTVLFVSGEDDPDDTLVPRLLEVGADLSRIHFLTTETLDRFTLRDLSTLEKALEQSGGELSFVAIDPPTAYLGGIDDHKNSELRSLLSPLKAWSSRHHLALVFNTHVNKGGGQKVEAMMRVMGSVAWVNAVRAAHMFARDPDDPERRLFVGMKNNLGKERKGLAYRIVESGELARIEWLGEVDVTADQAVNRDSGRPRKVIASDWLIERFRQKLEWPSHELFKLAGNEGISRNAMFEAKDRLRLPKARQVHEQNGDRHFVWWVPENWEGFGPDGRDTLRI